MTSERERFSAELKRLIGERCFQIRDAMELNQTEWAKMAGVKGHSAVSNWETGGEILGLKAGMALGRVHGPWIMAWLYFGDIGAVRRERPDLAAKLPLPPLGGQSQQR